MNTRRTTVKRKNKKTQTSSSVLFLLLVLVVASIICSFLTILRNLPPTTSNITTTTTATTIESSRLIIIKTPSPLIQIQRQVVLRATATTSNNNNKTPIIMSSINSSTQQLRTATKKAIQKLKELEINFLALDFDQTILDIHTGGSWKGTVEELYPHIRPEFKSLITSAISETNAEIEIAIVTFSCQTRMVRGVIDHIIDIGLDENTKQNIPGLIGIGGIVDTSSKIPIRGGDRSWRYNGSGSINGKQPHMASAVEELDTRREEEQTAEQQQRLNINNTTNSSSSRSLMPMPLPLPLPLPSSKPITRKSTLLLDDDDRNIHHALDNGVRAIWFDPKRPQDLLPEIMKLV
jgi:uncharacterized protein (UPF0333 family)